MGAADDVVETADIALMADDLNKISRRLPRATLRNC